MLVEPQSCRLAGSCLLALAVCADAEYCMLICLRHEMLVHNMISHAKLRQWRKPPRTLQRSGLCAPGPLGCRSEEPQVWRLMG